MIQTLYTLKPLRTLIDWNIFSFVCSSWCWSIVGKATSLLGLLLSCAGQLVIEGSRNRQCQEIWFPPSWNPRDLSILISKFTIYTRSYECRLQKLAVPWQKDLHSSWQCLVFCLPDINMSWSPLILSKDLASNLIKGSCTYYVITFGGPERPPPM